MIAPVASMKEGVTGWKAVVPAELSEPTGYWSGPRNCASFLQLDLRIGKDRTLGDPRWLWSEGAGTSLLSRMEASTMAILPLVIKITSEP